MHCLASPGPASLLPLLPPLWGSQDSGGRPASTSPCSQPSLLEKKVFYHPSMERPSQEDSYEQSCQHKQNVARGPLVEARPQDAWPRVKSIHKRGALPASVPRQVTQTSVLLTNTVSSAACASILCAPNKEQLCPDTRGFLGQGVEWILPRRGV